MDVMFVFNNIQIIIPTIRRMKKRHNFIDCLGRMDTCERVNTLRLQHLFYTCQSYNYFHNLGYFDFKIGNKYGRWPNTTQCMIIIGFVVTLQMDRKRNAISSFQ